MRTHEVSGVDTVRGGAVPDPGGAAAGRHATGPSWLRRPPSWPTHISIVSFRIEPNDPISASDRHSYTAVNKDFHLGNIAHELAFKYLPNILDLPH